MTNSISKRENEFKIVGISKEQNEKFWKKQYDISIKFSKLFKFYLIFTCISFNLPLLFMRYDSNLFIFIPNLIIVISHYSIYIR